MKLLRVKSWGDFQHYKDRAPPWIKLHKGLLDNYEYQSLPIASRALAPMIWLLASESIDGSVEYDIKKLAFRLRQTETDIKDGLEPLIQQGFLVLDSEVLAERFQDACLETEVETEIEIKTPLSGKPDDAVEVLNFLNVKTDHQYQPVDANLKLIRARFKEGATLQDMKMIIAMKRREWKDKEDFAKYLRPATLFDKTKFWQYHGQLLLQEAK